VWLALNPEAVKINAKYDAELKALEQQPTSTNQPESNTALSDVESTAKQELDADKLNKEAGVDIYVARQEVESGGNKYYLSQIKENNSTNTFLIEDANGNEIGKAQLSKDGNFLENIRIDEKHRRKGLASKVYDFIELRKGIELEPSPNKQSKEAKALWDKRNLQKSVSNKANGGLLAKALGESMSKAFSDFRKKQEVLLELENRYFKQKGLSREDFNKLSESDKADVIKDAVKWKNENPELVKAVESLLSKEQTSVIEEINSKNLTRVEGLGMGMNQAVGTYISTESGNRYETDGNAQKVTVTIKNPLVVTEDIGLIELRNQNVNKFVDEFEDIDFDGYENPNKEKLSIEDLSETGLAKLAEITTRELKKQGYDSIYFRESDIQEGELVIFDKQNVTIDGKEQQSTSNEIEQDKAIKAIGDKAKDAEDNNDAAVAKEVIDKIDAEIKKTAEQQARDNGKKIVDGTVVKRQGKIKALLGNAVNLLFSKQDSQEARYAIIELSDLQPSHKSGVKNENHFIPEAQPRDRGGLAVLKNEAKQKADNLDPNQLGENNIAYFGSPIINERGEVIQGNGRAEAIDYYYRNNKKDSRGYKAMIKEKAVSLGINVDEVAKMKNPVLVRLAYVTDEQAIILGNKTASELEDVKQKGADVKAAMGKLNPQKIAEFTKVINSKIDETSTLKSIIRDNAKIILDKLIDLGAVRADEKEQFFNGIEVTPEGIQKAYDITRQLLFDGGDADLQNKFDNLPAKIRNAIEKTIPAILSNTELKSKVQDVINHIYNFYESGNKGFDNWTNQRDIFGDQKTPLEKYDNETLKFAKQILEEKTEKDIAKRIVQVAQNMNGKEGNMFDEATPKKPFNEAIQFSADNSVGKETTTPQDKKEVSKIIEFFNKMFGFDGFAPFSEFNAKLKSLGYDSLQAMVTSSRGSVPKVRGGWTKEKIVKYLKSKSSDSKGSYGIIEAISSFDSFEDFKNSVYYHGTSNAIEGGLKPSITMSEMEAERNGGGGYGERYFGISLTKRKRTAESFSGQSRSVTVYPVILKKDANVIVREDLQDASEIEDIIVELYEQGVDAVWIGGGEQELVVVNPASAILYKKGSDSYQVYGGFKSENPTDAELKSIYDKAKKDYPKLREELKTKFGKDDRNEFLNSVEKIQFLKTPSGKVLGFVSDGKIYLNPNALTAKTAFHELAHVQQALIKIAAQKGDAIAKAVMQRWDKLMKDNDVIGQVRKFSKGKGTPTQFSITMPDGSTKQVQPINADVVNGFYSPLEKIINETKFDKLPAKQWIDKFAKGEEAKWTGLTDWLSSQQGSVSKADIQQYLKDNRIQVVEVVKSENNRIASEDEILDAVYSNDWVELGNGVRAKGDVGGFSIVEINGNRQRLPRVEAENLINKKLSTKDQSTKFSNYQLEGEKENYKEVLVTMPQKTEKANYEVVKKGDLYYPTDKVRNIPTSPYPTFEQAKAESDRLNKGAVERTSKDTFKSTHFEEPNILVHLRMNTRTDANGNKVLFLEEVQSDWGQKGKKEGFEITVKNKTEAIDAIKKGFQLRPYGKLPIRTENELNNYTGNFPLTANESNKNGFTPTAPFVTDTNAWTKLALKVALKEAVKQGADKIAWSTGTQQFDRWGSEEISWRKNTARTPQEEARMKELGEKIVNYKDTNEERIEHEKLARKEGGFSVLINEQTTGATAFNGQEIGNRDDVTIQSKEDLKKAIKKNLSRERNDAEIDKLTERIWNRMQTEDSGTSLPRKEGMEEFYGNPKDVERAKGFTIKKEGELFAVKDEKGKTIRTFKQENEANKFKENYGLGIVGNVAKSLFKQEVGTVEIQSENFDTKKIQYLADKYDVPVSMISKAVRTEDLEHQAEIGLTKDEVKVVEDFLKGSTKQHTIDITPELKSQVEQGQALFQAEGDGKRVIKIKDTNKTHEIDLSASVYDQAENESDVDYEERIMNEVWSYLTDAKNAKLWTEATKGGKIRNFINAVANFFKRKLGLKGMTVDEIMNSDLKTLIERTTNSLMKGEWFELQNEKQAKTQPYFNYDPTNEEHVEDNDIINEYIDAVVEDGRIPTIEEFKADIGGEVFDNIIDKLGLPFIEGKFKDTTIKDLALENISKKQKASPLVKRGQATLGEESRTLFDEIGRTYTSDKWKEIEPQVDAFVQRILGSKDFSGSVRELMQWMKDMPIGVYLNEDGLATAHTMILNKLVMHSYALDKELFKEVFKFAKIRGTSFGQAISAYAEASTPESLFNNAIGDLEMEKENILDTIQPSGLTLKEELDNILEQITIKADEITSVLDAIDEKTQKTVTKTKGKRKSTGTTTTPSAVAPRSTEQKKKAKERIDKAKSRLGDWLQKQGIVKFAYNPQDDLNEHIELLSISKELVLGYLEYGYASALKLKEKLQDALGKNINVDDIWISVYDEEVRSKVKEVQVEVLEKAILSALSDGNGKQQDMITQLAGLLRAEANKLMPKKENKTNVEEKVKLLFENKELSKLAWENALQKGLAQIESSNLTDEQKAERKKALEDAIGNFVTVPNSVSRKAIQVGLKDLKETIEDIAKMHFTEASNVVETLVDKLVMEAGLSHADAVEYAKILTDEINKQLKDKKVKLLDKLLNTKSRKVVKLTELEKIINAVNLGALSSSDFSNLFAKKFGFKAITPEQIQYLHDTINLMFETNGIMRRRMAQKLADYIDSMKPLWDARAFWRLIQNVVHQHALNGANTYGNIVIGSTASVVSNLLGSLALNFNAFKRANKAYNKAKLKGTGTKAAIDTMWTGYNDMHNFTTEENFVEKGSRYHKWVNKWGYKSVSDFLLLLYKPIAQLGYFASAFDNIVNHRGGEILNYIAEYNALDKKGMSIQDIYDLVEKKMGYADADMFSQQVDEEIQDYKANGIKIPIGFKEQRLKELMISHRDKERQLKAYETVRTFGLMGKPDGLSGSLYDFLKPASIIQDTDSNLTAHMKGIYSTTIALFLRISFASAGAVINSTPILGFFAGAYRIEKNEETKKREFRRATGREYAHTAVMQTASIVSLVFGFMAMFDLEDDENGKTIISLDPDRLIDISGTNIEFFDQEKLRLDNGQYKSLSIRFRTSKDSKWGPFREVGKYLPFAVPNMAILGNLRDRILIKQEDNKEDDLKQIYPNPKEVLNSLLSIGGGLQVASYNSLAQFISKASAIASYKNNSPEIQAEKKMQDAAKLAYNTITRPAKTILQTNLHRDITKSIAALANSQKKSDNIYMNVFKDFYGFDPFINHKELDIFGNKAMKIAPVLDKDERYNMPEWKLLREKNIVFDPPYFYKTGTFDGEKVKITNDERLMLNDRVSVEFGNLIRENLNELKTMTQLELLQEFRMYATLAKAEVTLMKYEDAIKPIDYEKAVKRFD
jgi:hypothetical protein